MRALVKDDDVIILDGNTDPFIITQQALMVEMGYRIVEDWQPKQEEEMEEQD